MSSMGGYLVWPAAANLGETVGILVNAKAGVDLAPDGGAIEVDPASFVIRLTDPNSNVESPQPRAAIEAPAALGSVLVENEAGSWTGIVLLVDLPVTWTQSTLNYGVDDLLVDVVYEGQILFSGQSLRVMGDGGSPLSAAEFEPIRELQQRPMLRFRPSWEAGSSTGFNPMWQIHGVEFVLHYIEPATGDVANLAPTVNGDAAGALALIEELAAPVGEKRWRVSIVDSDGFSISDKGCVGSGDCYAGRWSLVDIALDKLDEGLPVDTEIFKPSDFTIKDVVVLDASGAQLNQPSPGATFFRLHAVNNLVDPPFTPPTPDPLLVWPKVIRLGDSVAVLFNTEADVLLDPDAAYLDASKDNVVVHVSAPDGDDPVPLIPVAVVELPAALGSEMVGSPAASQTGVVVFFELPDPWPNPGLSLPAFFDIEVKYDGVLTSGVASVEVVGTGGSATDFSPVASLDALALGDMLRLRPVWNEDAVPAEGFDPAWQIGSLEFLLRYTQSDLGEVTDVGAAGNGEAIAGLAMADRLPDQPPDDKLWRIHLISPDGVALPDPELSSTGPSPVGRWALLDLPVDAQANGELPSSVFLAGEFAVEDMRVYGLDGSRLNPTHQGEPFFKLTAVVPEPSAAWQLFAGVLGLWGLERRRRARSRTQHV